MVNEDINQDRLKGRRLWQALSYLKYSKDWISVGLIAAALTVCLQLYLPWMMKVLFDALTGSHLAVLAKVVFTLAMVGIGAGLCEALKDYAFAAAAERILAKVREHLYSRFRALPLAYFQKERTGKAMAVLTIDAPALVKLYCPVLGEAFVSVLELLAALTILTWVFGWLTLLAPLACALYLIIPFISVKRLRHLNQKKLRLNAQLSADLAESISATREVQAFSREDWDRERLRRTFRAYLPLQRSIGLLQIGASSNMLIYWAIAGFFYWLGGRNVLTHELSLGSLFAMVWYFTFLDVPVRRIVGLNDQLQSALAASDSVFDLMGTSESASQQEDSKDLLEISGRINFDNVDFAYEPGTPVLRRVNFSVFPGERIAIVGPSGAGKSTLLGLVLRLHNVRSGRILIDGEDISRISVRSLRRQIGVVFQDTFLFNTSVRENIRFAKLKATNEEVIVAATAANADAFVHELPRGYDTEVGERGTKLSGGQKQRIAIARAILMDPRILILDEPTSSLDSQAEMEVREALELLMQGRTTLQVSHRLAAIANTDRIVVLDQGQVVAIGNHSQLMNECAWYRQSYQLQTLACGTRTDPVSGAGVDTSADVSNYHGPSRDGDAGEPMRVEETSRATADADGRLLL